MFQPRSTLTAATVKAVYEAGLAAIRAGATAIDFAQVTAVDSAAVAAMVGWQRAAHRLGVPVAFHNLPPSLHSLAALYGVADLLLSGAPAPHAASPGDASPRH